MGVTVSTQSGPTIYSGIEKKNQVTGSIPMCERLYFLFLFFVSNLWQLSFKD